MSDTKIHTDAATRNDNLLNVATSMGQAGRARNPATRFVTPADLSDEDLDAIYLGDGFGKRIVDIYANEMTREWFKVEGDPDGLILKYLEKLDAKTSLNYALKWSRLYGASLVMMMIDDGRDLSEPVNINAIKSIDFLRVIDKTQISVEQSTDRYGDVTQSNYGTPKIYTISPGGYTGGINASAYRVHESRTLRFDGEIMRDTLMRSNGGFGMSVLVPVYTYLRNFAQIYEYASEIVHDFVISVVSVKNLSALAQTPPGNAVIKDRAETMAYCKSVLNGVMIDADGEAYDKISTSVAGLPDMIDRFGLALASVTAIPYMLLMGESPSGLNANADNTVRSWYDSISAEQEEILLPQLNKLLSYILASSDSPLKGKNIDDIQIIFNSLWQYDQPTEIDMRNKQAQTDQIYMQNGVVLPEEIATSRFGGDQYSFDTTIDEALRD